MRSKDDIDSDLIGIKLSATMLGADTHSIAAVAHLLVYGKPVMDRLDVQDMRRAVDRIAAIIADIDQKVAAVERDIPAPHRPEYAREMEVV